MPLLDASRSILVVIDFQGKLVQMVHRPALALEATRRLLRLADLFAVPVVLTEQYPRASVPPRRASAPPSTGSPRPPSSWRRPPSLLRRRGL